MTNLSPARRDEMAVLKREFYDELVRCAGF